MKNFRGLKTTEKILQDEFRKSISEITQKEMDVYIEKIKGCYTYSTLRTKITLMNILLKDNGSDAKVELKGEKINTLEKGIITKKELDGMLEMLDNAQDKFIIMAVFNGIAGKQASNLLNLKRTDIDLKNKTIQIEDRTIKMNEDFYKITKDALEQELYTILSMDVGSGNITTECYEFSKATPYAVKVRPTKRNNMGTNAMSYNGFRSRFADICKMLDLDVTVLSLEKSGYIHRMSEEKVSATVTDIQNWLKKENIKSDIYLLLRLYKKMKECYNI